MASERERSDSRDEALRAMLVAQGRGSREAVAGGAPRTHRGRRLRTGVVTAGVALLVLAASATAIVWSRSSGASGRVAASPTATDPVHTPGVTGRVLAVLTEAGGQRQRRTVSPHGDAIAVSFRCRGGGSLAIHVPQQEDDGTSCGTAEGGGSSGGDGGGLLKGIDDPIVVTVAASSPNSTWTVTIRAIAATFVTPTPVTTARTSSGSAVPFCTADDLTARFSTLREPTDVTEADGGQIALTNRNDRECALAGYPRLQFVDSDGAPIGRSSNEHEDQRRSTDAGIAAVLVRPGGTAWVQLDYYNARYFADGHAQDTCPTVDVERIRVDLANRYAGPGQHGTMVVRTPTIAACDRSATLQLFGSVFVDYAAVPGR